MKKLLRWDVLSIAFVASIVVFGSSIVSIMGFGLSPKGKFVFGLIVIASFFTSISLIIQLIERRNKNDSGN